ncbi:hypothetical protein PTSG_06146 [Salpingoeca rosetta]|uniref:Sulfotransferase domain-containing protein n=1 Tax=Salpingoeca rosetta (strain ATCC 50818 / BSB-021) TaxID=946362 RepID=F2UC30_SALR5|nr:uncharacterized protein PTSG_06146 [Salpingoeca rosetta]EGD74137.1 hypothetical protein PTSG_06146 [Salpingoeca rosetta]|eukprot:XP_004993038.1 hypothetical protein PTSG_06146 [Salpingoeca rosetta]
MLPPAPAPARRRSRGRVGLGGVMFFLLVLVALAALSPAVTHARMTDDDDAINTTTDPSADGDDDDAADDDAAADDDDSTSTQPFHRHAFVVGQHHSGTTLLDLLLAMNPNVTRLTDTGQAEDEGQHLQSVYTTARKIGGARRWFYHEDAHKTERDVRSPKRTKRKLVKAWSPYWDMSKPVLLEKSPRHTTMTRYMQRIFGLRTVFFVTIRHPLGAMYHFYHRFNAAKQRQYYNDCAELDIKGFLTVYDWLVQDLPYLENVGIVSLETLLDRRNTEAVLHVAEHMLGLAPNISINAKDVPLDNAAYLEEANKGDIEPLPAPHIVAPTAAGDLMKAGAFDYKSRAQRSPLAARNGGGGGDSGADGDGARWDDVPSLGASRNHTEVSSSPPPPSPSSLSSSSTTRAQQRRRQLLHYHGSRAAVEVHTGPGAQFSWVETFKQLQPNFTQRCAHVIDKYEARVNAYGYSLRKLTQHFLPSALYPYLLLPEAYPHTRINNISEQVRQQQG